MMTYIFYLYDWCPGNAVPSPTSLPLAAAPPPLVPTVAALTPPPTKSLSPCSQEIKHLPRGCFNKNSNSSCSVYHSANLAGITGELQDFPKTVEYINLTETWNVSGDVKDLPRMARYIDLHSAQSIIGDVNQLPKTADYLDFHSSVQLTGAVASFENTVGYVDMTSSELDGTEKDLPCTLSFLSLHNALNRSHDACVKTCSSYECPPGMMRRPGTHVGSSWQGCCQNLTCSSYECPSGYEKNLDDTVGHSWKLCCTEGRRRRSCHRRRRRRYR